MNEKLSVAAVLVGCAIGLCSQPGERSARADEKARPVRTTVTVEVIDNARQVEDIIARVRAQQNRATQVNGARRSATVPPPAPRRELERPPLPPAREREEKVRQSPVRDRERREHERPQPAHSPRR
jgi:hypothetical protein